MYNIPHLQLCIGDRNYSKDGIYYTYHSKKCFFKNLFVDSTLEKLYKYDFDDDSNCWKKYDCIKEDYCSICYYKYSTETEEDVDAAASEEDVDAAASEDEEAEAVSDTSFLPEFTYFPVTEAHVSNGRIFRRQFGCCDCDDEFYGADNPDTLIEIIEKSFVL